MTRSQRAFHFSPAGMAIALAGLLGGLQAPLRPALADVPFTVTAASGGASARLDATVTRNGVTLPAAYVPSLRDGDVVRIDFGDFKRPHATWNYLVDVAFITAEGRTVWLFPTDVAAAKLYGPKGKGAPVAPAITFTYGRNGYRGIPIVLIVPDDKGAGGLDNVRAYVGAHPNDFVTGAVSSKDAVDQQGWITNFLAAMQNGAIDPFASQAYVESLSTEVGAPASSIQACYVPGATTAAVSTCIYGAVSALDVPTNYNANTVSGFFGSAVGSTLGAVPPLYSLAIKSALTVWSLFHKNGHDRYGYLPATLQMADAGASGNGELLRTVEAPTIRPPAAESDVLFFTLGAADTQAPVIERDGSADVCAAGPGAGLPLHLDHTSLYVHDAELDFVARSDPRRRFTLPLDASGTAGPLVPRAVLERRGAGAAAWNVTMRAEYGFDAVQEAAREPLAVALPHPAGWTIVDRTPAALRSKSIDLIATSDAVSCLSSAELHQGRAASVPLSIKPFAPGSVALHADLGSAFDAGPAEVTFAQDDPARRSGAPEIVATQAVRIGEPAPEVSSADGGPAAYAGDRAIALSGARFESVDTLRLDGLAYAKAPASTSAAACFTGPPVPQAPAPGAAVSAQLLGGGEVLRVFELTLRRPRLSVTLPSIVPGGNVHVASAPVQVLVESPQQPLPSTVQIALRKAPAMVTACDGLLSAASPGAILSASGTLPLGAKALQATFEPEAVLGSAAFGTLQLQVIDPVTKSRSDWVALPGTFVRAPLVSKIVCPASSGDSCRLMGTELNTIAAFDVAAGAPVKAPFQECAADDAHDNCIVVPHLAHYAIESVDGGIVVPLPDTLIQAAKS
jgi:hypothetical protein